MLLQANRVVGLFCSFFRQTSEVNFESRERDRLVTLLHLSWARASAHLHAVCAGLSALSLLSNLLAYANQIGAQVQIRTAQRVRTVNPRLSYRSTSVLF